MKRQPTLTKRQRKLLRGDRTQIAAGRQLERRGMAVVDAAGRITITLRGQGAYGAAVKRGRATRPFKREPVGFVAGG
jgi:hypothetical protein